MKAGQAEVQTELEMEEGGLEVRICHGTKVSKARRSCHD